MSILEEIGTPGDKPLIATITGEPGAGKTMFASTFPNPLFLKIEDGMEVFPIEKRPPAYPKEGVIESSKELFDILTALYKDPHDYKTVVFDSVTKLDELFQNEIVENDPKNPASINQANGGYGNGHQAVAQLHQRVRKAAGKLRKDRGMHVVFIAHSTIVKRQPPDHEMYTRYELDLNEKSQSSYESNVGLVGFLKLETYATDGKAMDTGNRILVVRTCATHISKNRFQITKDLPVIIGQNPLTPYIGSLK